MIVEFASSHPVTNLTCLSDNRKPVVRYILLDNRSWLPRHWKLLRSDSKECCSLRLSPNSASLRWRLRLKTPKFPQMVNFETIRIIRVGIAMPWNQPDPRILRRPNFTYKGKIHGIIKLHLLTFNIRTLPTKGNVPVISEK